jgi:hypothetical protein
MSNLPFGGTSLVPVNPVNLSNPVGAPTNPVAAPRDVVGSNDPVGSCDPLNTPARKAAFTEDFVRPVEDSYFTRMTSVFSALSEGATDAGMGEYLQEKAEIQSTVDWMVSHVYFLYLRYLVDHPQILPPKIKSFKADPFFRSLQVLLSTV